MDLIRRMFLGALLLLSFSAGAQERFITVASTTSTEQSGLFKHLLPVFEKKTGIQVRVVALGTGQALDMGRRGDADVEFVHDKVAEEKFLAEGFGVKRYEVMYNDFVIVGPKDDPAGAKGNDVVAALKKIAAMEAPFASRGDKSGTDAAEKRYWTQAGLANVIFYGMPPGSAPWTIDVDQDDLVNVDEGGFGSNPFVFDTDLDTFGEQYRVALTYTDPVGPSVSDGSQSSSAPERN